MLEIILFVGGCVLVIFGIVAYDTHQIRKQEQEKELKNLIRKK